MDEEQDQLMHPNDPRVVAHILERLRTMPMEALHEMLCAGAGPAGVSAREAPVVRRRRIRQVTRRKRRTVTGRGA